MNPKEKAEELVDKYRIILIQSDTDAGEEILCTGIAKQCALIAVDEIIDAIDWHEYEVPNMQLIFWDKVIKEIEEL